MDAQPHCLPTEISKIYGFEGVKASTGADPPGKNI